MAIQTAGVIPTWTTADRLRKAREHAGYDYAGLAREIGVSKNTIGNYERGVVTPRRPVLVAWALATGVPLEWIVECAVRDSNPEPADVCFGAVAA